MDESDDHIEIESAHYNFDGTCILGELKRRSSDNYRQTYGERVNGTYSVSGDILTITEGSDNDTYKFKVTINSDGTIDTQRIRSDGSLGSTDRHYLLPPTSDPQAALEAVMEGLAARRRN